MITTGNASVEIADKLDCEIHMYPEYGHAAYDEAKDFIKGLKVDEKTNLGKNLENTELDESQLSEIKNVYAHQKNDQMRTSNSGEER